MDEYLEAERFLISEPVSHLWCVVMIEPPLGGDCED